MLLVGSISRNERRREQSAGAPIMLAARAETDRLFALVRPNFIYERPIPERHRLIFYLGHLEAFDWNLLCRRTLSMRPFDAAFDKLFEFGIDPPPGEMPSDSPSDWPSVDEVLAYVARIRPGVDAALADVPTEIAQVAIEHRLMHAETLAYLLHQLPYHAKHAPVPERHVSGPPPTRVWITIPPGTATVGKSRDGSFGWDNEFEEHAVDVPGFAVSKYKVTNGEYLEFVESGAAPPHFWIEKKAEWRLRTMFADIPLPLDWPVYATQTEASSFAAWRGLHLLTEPQYHRAAYGTPSGHERLYPWGDQPPEASRGNFNFRRWDPLSVTQTSAGDSAFGVSQLCGNGWEWTSTPFAPFAGFRPAPYYTNYSAPFFDGEHYVLKGASSRTADCLLRRSLRNWFRPAYPYMYATFRCAGSR